MPARPFALLLAALVLPALGAAPAAAQGLGGIVVDDPYDNLPPIRLGPDGVDVPRGEPDREGWRERREERAAFRREMDKLSDEAARELEKAEEEHARERRQAERELDRELAGGRGRGEAVAKYRERVRALDDTLDEKLDRIEGKFREKAGEREDRLRD